MTNEVSGGGGTDERIERVSEDILGKKNIRPIAVIIFNLFGSVLLNYLNKMIDGANSCRSTRPNNRILADDMAKTILSKLGRADQNDAQLQ